jgi:hypothetical protein
VNPGVDFAILWWLVKGGEKGEKKFVWGADSSFSRVAERQ